MNKAEHKVHEPLFHISKRPSMTKGKVLALNLFAIIIGLVFMGVFVVGSSSSGKGFFDVFSSLLRGSFGIGYTKSSAIQSKLLDLFKETSLLLCVALALIPAFKMKFWNLGGNGQILMGALACTLCMYYLGGKLPGPVVIIIEIVASLAAGALWAVIPAIFKSFFKTNESLFTLMMNYIAYYIVLFFVTWWDPHAYLSSSKLDTSTFLPVIGTEYGLLFIITVVLLIGMALYLRYTKHGYEISVVGESENTAKYIGINVKKVTIRTLVVSGALCGMVGLLLSGSIHHTVNPTIDGNMGFTAIMVAWLGNFNPGVMAVFAFFIAIITNGMATVRMDFAFNSEATTDIIMGVIYFLILAVTFFITYKINLRADLQEKADKVKKFFSPLAVPFKKLAQLLSPVAKAVGGFFKKIDKALRKFFTGLSDRIKNFFKNLFKKKEDK